MKNTITKSRLVALMLLAVVLSTAFQCSNDSHLLESVPQSEYINNCPDMWYDFGEMVSIGDPNARFIVRLPYSWDIRESYTDSLYGVFAANYLSVPLPAEERLALSVLGYQTDKDLDQYVHDELIDLVKDESTQVLERGKTMFAGRNNPWVLFKMEEQIFNMVYYFKEPGTSDVYLIQAVSYDSVRYRNTMCHLKQLVNSFELIPPVE